MISTAEWAKQGRNTKPASQARELGLWSLAAAFVAGLVLHMLGRVGQALALLGLAGVVVHLLSQRLEGKMWSGPSSLLLGCLVSAELFIRDFALRGLPAGYLGVQYLMIILGVAGLSALARYRRLLASAPVLIFVGICLWDGLGLFYSPDLWLGRITTAYHFAGLACLVLGAAAFSSEHTRRGLLDGLILGTFLSLGVMLRQTVRSSYGMDLDSGIRFGHALTSAVQVGIVLTTGMLACLLKLVSGYGTARNALIPLALLAPFCIATFSRGPLLAFLAAAVCLSLYRRRSRGWWKLPAAGLLLAAAVLVVMWFLPSNFDNRYRELQGKDERGRIWAVVFEMWKQSPIIGYGPGSWFVVYPRFAAVAERVPERVSDAHNFLLQAASDGGSVGVLLFLLFVLALTYCSIRARSPLALSLFTFVFIAASLANFKISVLFLLLGAGLGECLARRSSSPASLSSFGARVSPSASFASRTLVFGQRRRAFFRA